MKITELLQFDICDTYVKTIKGDISAYRYFPPNISILPQNEIKAYIDKFNMLIDNLQNTPLTICCMDCNENLENNKKFYSSLPPKYEYITADIIKDISRGSSGSVGTQRGFYFLITTKNQVEIERFERIVKESELNVTKLNKSDIIVLLRGFLLRDFCDNTFNLEDIENDNVK